MILVDTSVWIEFFRARDPIDLARYADIDEVVTCLPVVQRSIRGCAASAHADFQLIPRFP